MPVYDNTLFDPPAPIARVTLRNPNSGILVTDVAMLVDTGADATLLPHSIVSQIGVDIDPTEGYELMGFDGRVSIARVVQLDLVFLRRSFKGRFLLIDQEWGIIGRDVLNYLSLHFDGPRLIWQESQ